MAKIAGMDSKIVSIVLMVVGVGLIIWGYQMSGAVTSQFSKALTGLASDGVMIRYILGGVSLVVGAYLFKKN